jgi:DNA-binding transcriptional LysR family regulator
MDRFLSIEAFVLVAETQSFADAARQMRVSKSVITTRVRQLEDFVGAPLFHRTTRSVRLSEIGQAFYRDCAELIGRTDELVDQMRDMKRSPAGLLRVHALPGFVLGHLARLLREFQDRYPGIVLDLVVNDAVIDPVKEGFDCTLQIFPPSSDALVERRLFPVRRVFCASPEYLHKHGEPIHPRELLQHRLALYSSYPTHDRWLFHSGAERIPLELKPALSSNSVHLLRDYACEHAGIVCIPTLVAADAVLAGTLTLLLPNFQLSSFWLSLVFPRTHRGTFKLRLFLESLSASFAGDPPWDRALIDRGLIPAEIIE